jgi:hypothetical protein
LKDFFTRTDKHPSVRAARLFESPGYSVANVADHGGLRASYETPILRSFVHTFVDVREPNGWRDLRLALSCGDGGDVERLALTALADDLAPAPEDCRRFFDALFKAPARTSTVRELALALGTLPSTLMSRFFRARLPAPKRYLSVRESLSLTYHKVFRPIFERASSAVAMLSDGAQAVACGSAGDCDLAGTRRRAPVMFSRKRIMDSLTP